MKRKINHMKHDKNTDLTVAWLTQTIDAELARGEEADEQLILECTAYLQALSTEAVPSAEVTEQYLQAELNRAETAPRIVRRKAPRIALKVALRFAAVLTALTLFLAIPVMAAQSHTESGYVSIANSFVKPVLEILAHTEEPEAIAYPKINEYKKEPGYTATYKTTKDLLIKEQPADLLCLTDLPEVLGKYEIRVIHHGRTNEDQWRIHWLSKDNRWGYLIAYSDNRALSRDLNRVDYEKTYERHTVNDRTYFYKVKPDGSYWATCIQGRIQYSVLAPDFETMTLLIDHTAYASDIIPSATETLPLLTPEQYSPLDIYPDPYGHFNQYIAYYETTEDFLKNEYVDILTVNDHAADLGDFWIRVTSHAASRTPFKWSVTWRDENNQWSFSANYEGKNVESYVKAAEHLPQYYEPYKVGERTFYICEISQGAQEILFGDYTLLANYYEGNMLYAINATDRETLELLINNLVQAKAE